MTSEITRQGIDAMDRTLALFSKVLDQVVPWQEYENTVKELDRYSNDYSSESAQLVSQIKNVMNSAHDSYYAATQSIYVWCGAARTLLAEYLALAGVPIMVEKNRAIFIQVLDLGITKMSAAKDDIDKSSASFNDLSGKLTTIHSRFTNEFDSKSSYFEGKKEQIRKEAYAGAASGIYGGPLGLIISYSIAAGVVEGKLIPELVRKLSEIKSFFDNLKALVDKTNVDIDDTKNKLKAEIQHISDMKILTADISDLIDLDNDPIIHDEIKSAANSLISQCEEYQRSHGKSN